LKVHPWIRLNRVIRDIPNQYIVGGNEVTNLRQVLLHRLRVMGKSCKCIRCREVRSRKTDVGDAELVERNYLSSGGREIFISFETSNRDVIFGFCRLRLSPRAGIECNLPELHGAALIRELHVYGQMRPVGDRKRSKKAQHVGFGSRLMYRAEEIARRNGYGKIAVIAGIGTRRYYQKLGYRLEGTYMVKHMDPWRKTFFILLFVFLLALLLFPVP